MNLLTLEINRQCGVRVEKLSYNEEIISSISASRLQVISVQEHLKLYKKKKLKLICKVFEAFYQIS